MDRTRFAESALLKTWRCSRANALTEIRRLAAAVGDTVSHVMAPGQKTANRVLEVEYAQWRQDSSYARNDFLFWSGLLVLSVAIAYLLILTLGLGKSLWLTIPIWILLTAVFFSTLITTIFWVWTTTILGDLILRGHAARAGDFASESGMGVLGLGEMFVYLANRADSFTDKPVVSVHPYSELGSPQIFRARSEIVLAILSVDGRELGRLYFADKETAQLGDAIVLLASRIRSNQLPEHRFCS